MAKNEQDMKEKAMNTAPAAQTSDVKSNKSQEEIEEETREEVERQQNISAYEEQHSSHSEKMEGDSLEIEKAPTKKEYPPDMATRPLRPIRPSAGPRQMRPPRGIPRPVA